MEYLLHRNVILMRYQMIGNSAIENVKVLIIRNLFKSFLYKERKIILQVIKKGNF